MTSNDKEVKYVCLICGYEDDQLPDKCPICGADSSNFEEVEE